jgi:hypothetical protein
MYPYMYLKTVNPRCNGLIKGGGEMSVIADVRYNRVKGATQKVHAINIDTHNVIILYKGFLLCGFFYFKWFSNYKSFLVSQHF